MTPHRSARFPRQAGALAALATALLILAPAGAENAETAESETVVSNEICSGLFLMPLVWTSSEGERHELLAVFDTGASRAFIDPDSIERISGKRLEPGTRAVMRDVTVAGLSFSKFSPRVRELDHIGLALGRKFDVFLPFQTFDSVLLTLDYGARQMRISRGSLPRPDGEEVFSAKGRDSRPWIRTRVGSRERSLLLDSGSNGSISVKPHRSVRWAGESAMIRLAQGISDLELNEVGRFDGTIRIGPLDFVEPFIGLTDDTELIGYDALRHFVLTFDQENERVRMRPISTPPVRMEAQTGTGALLRPREHALEVARIIPGSPADLAGLRPGDQVTHIDGVPVHGRGCHDMQPRSGPIEYTIRRGPDERTVRLRDTVLLP